MNCPACAHQLRTIRYEGVSIESCDGCGGEFVSGSEMGRIVRARDERFGADHSAWAAGRGPVFGIKDADATTRFCCPQCRVPMNPINYATDSGVIVDRCGECGGMWLENSELEKIQTLLERWQDEAPGKISGAAQQLSDARAKSKRETSNTFGGSRVSFVNAVVNRLLDAA
ncbi:MAG: hypothetical protein AMXMBFR58_06250 [Phycisphaerae bacterium]